MSKLDKLVEQMTKRPSNALKLGAGETRYMRLFPSYDEEYEREAMRQGATLDAHSGVLVVMQHQWLPRIDRETGAVVTEGSNTNYRCLRPMRRRCPFCSIFDEFSIEDRKTFGRYMSKGRAFCHVYVKATGETKTWWFGPGHKGQGVPLQMQTIFDFYPEANHPQRGLLLRLHREGAGKFDTVYSFGVAKSKQGKIIQYALPVPPEDYPSVFDDLNDMPIIEEAATAEMIVQALLDGVGYKGENQNGGKYAGEDIPF